MKVLSFNVNKKNPALGPLIKFLKGQDADLICLQEYPAKELRRLRAFTGYHLHTADERFVHKFLPKRDRRLLLVILSKFPIQNAEAVRHLQHRALPLRHQIAYEEVAVHFHFVDITDNHGRSLRVFNCHLECTTTPVQRLAQFKEIARHQEQGRVSVFCGDFNTFSTPLVSPFVFWLFGYKTEHLAVHEPARFRDLFETLALQNPLHKQWTFSLLPIQLDYILLPKRLKVQDATMLPDTYGSDHHPITVEF